MGIKAMIIHSIHILATIIMANAHMGKTNIIHIIVLIANSKTIPKVIELAELWDWFSWLKFNALEYIVIRGHTNHLDLSMRVATVVHVMDFNRVFHHSYQKSAIGKKVGGLLSLQPTHQEYWYSQ